MDAAKITQQIKGFFKTRSEMRSQWSKSWLYWGSYPTPNWKRYAAS